MKRPNLRISGSIRVKDNKHGDWFPWYITVLLIFITGRVVIWLFS